MGKFRWTNAHEPWRMVGDTRGGCSSLRARGFGFESVARGWKGSLHAAAVWRGAEQEWSSGVVGNEGKAGCVCGGGG